MGKERVHRHRLSGRKPEWLKIGLPSGESFADLKESLRKRKLHTVCEEARCPNLGECWDGGTATFMVMGDTCTRGCRFCAIKTRKTGLPLDPDEPMKVAEASEEMGLDYIVITSVDRDDLEDGGAEHFAKVIESVHMVSGGRIMVEVLTPDFQGVEKDILRVASAQPTVFAHNMETVRRLSPSVRDPRSDYDQSLQVLKLVKQTYPEMITKTSLMLGLGETDEEVFQTMDDLREVGVDILTFGQYLQPYTRLLQVEEFVTPEKFDWWAEEGKKRGFAYVASGPMVRSSYRAGELFVKHVLKGRAPDASFEV
jgi:lipoic acid synthetase